MDARHSPPSRDETVASLAAKNLRIAPLPQRLLIKHGDFPLDVVKNYVLQWPGDHDNYPRLFVSKQGLPALLYPRLKTESAPKVTWFANSAGVQIESTAGTDYLFVSDANAEGSSPDRKATFQGQAGAIQVRGKATTLTLGTPGKLVYGDRGFESVKAASRTDAR